MGSSQIWLKMADEESKSIPHEFPKSNWTNATGQYVKDRYLSSKMRFWNQYPFSTPKRKNKSIRELKPILLCLRDFITFYVNCHLSRVMRKPAFCINKKYADQLFRYRDSTIPLFFQIQNLKSLIFGTCTRTWSKTRMLVIS